MKRAAKRWKDSQSFHGDEVFPRRPIWFPSLGISIPLFQVFQSVNNSTFGWRRLSTSWSKSDQTIRKKLGSSAVHVFVHSPSHLTETTSLHFSWIFMILPASYGHGLGAILFFIGLETKWNAGDLKELLDLQKGWHFLLGSWLFSTGFWYLESNLHIFSLPSKRSSDLQWKKFRKQILKAKTPHFGAWLILDRPQFRCRASRVSTVEAWLPRWKGNKNSHSAFNVACCNRSSRDSRFK